MEGMEEMEERRKDTCMRVCVCVCVCPSSSPSLPLLLFRAVSLRLQVGVQGSGSSPQGESYRVFAAVVLHLDCCQGEEPARACCAGGEVRARGEVKMTWISRDE